MFVSYLSEEDYEAICADARDAEVENILWGVVAVALAGLALFAYWQATLVF